ncbi:hypothetical protein HZF05_11045 [Sphingomonas sp. CGMCC 1.13654]|uniref:HTH luxR-type domain-containing protein n=1 Tax=Sphingomonas chungangi TaxID=2683589 RepID=A0A838L5J5_9SPHN|nr:LuxR C-terminal-related transcriptional regulator [Sphingomonas chungangi]MBA2934631.1 hypothetical protein [Sphingomonas chungangi]
MASAEDFERLTDRHKEILRLVQRRFETKDISHELDMSPGRVNKDIAQIKTILRVQRRVAAARLFHEFEAQHAPASEGHSVAGYPMSLPEAEISRSNQPVVEPLGTQRDDPDEFRETQMPYAAAGTLSLSIPLPFPTNGRPRNDLNTLSTTLVVMAMTLLGAGMASSIVSFVMNVNRLFLNLRGGQ